jgi:AcrR family transcriptional regulator
VRLDPAISFVNIAVMAVGRPVDCATVGGVAGPARTVRSERTRQALRKAAVLRFLAHGVEETSAEQIAADAGVSLRTFYRHFGSKHDLLFADFDAGLQWFRTALAARPAGESVIESVQQAIFAFPYDVEAVSQIAAMRAEELDAERIVRQMRQVEQAFADAVAEHLRRRASRGGQADPGEEALAIAVTARCIAAAVFAAMEDWMNGDRRPLDELARVSRAALAALQGGMVDDLFRP